MNHLERIKQQLMVKPDIQERERVAVVIKGEKKPKAIKERKKAEKTIGDEILKGVTDLGEQISVIQQLEGIIPATIHVPEMSELKKYGKEETKRPLIIDKTNQGYDRETLLKKLAEQYFLIKNQADGAFNTVSAFEELAGSTNNLLPTSVYNRIKIGVAHVVNHVNPNAAKVSIDKVSQDMDKANTLAKVQKMGDDFIEKIKALDIEKQSQAIEKLFGETNSEYLKYNISNLKGFFKKSFLILDKEERERIKKFLSDGFGLRRLDSDYYSMMKNLFEKDIIPFMESVDLNARVLKNKKRLASFCDDITKILEAPGQQNKIQCIYGLFHVNNLDDTNNQVEELSRILKKDLNGLTNTDTRMIELVFKYYDLKITNEDYSKIKEWFEKITPLIHSVLENARKEAEAKKKADAENAQKSNYFEPAVEIANAYKVLGVEPGAAPDQVTNAYRILARKNHPDKQINQSEDVKNKAEATMKELNNAIALLRNNGRAL